MSNANQSANRPRAGDQPVISPPTIEERIRAVELMRRDRAARWGRFAWRIAKGGGFIVAGLGASAVGSLFGVPHIGAHLVGHAAEPFGEIIEDPPWDRDY
jgi:hypothetical protein